MFTGYLVGGWGEVRERAKEILIAVIYVSARGSGVARTYNRGGGVLPGGLGNTPQEQEYSPGKFFNLYG